MNVKLLQIPVRLSLKQWAKRRNYRPLTAVCIKEARNKVGVFRSQPTIIVVDEDTNVASIDDFHKSRIAGIVAVIPFDESRGSRLRNGSKPATAIGDAMGVPLHQIYLRVRRYRQQFTKDGVHSQT